MALLAQIQFAMGDVESALEFLQKIPLDDVSIAAIEALLLQSRLYAEQDRLEEAISLAKHSVEIADRKQDEPNKRKANLFLAALYWFQQNSPQAVSLAERVIRTGNDAGAVNQAHLLAAAVLIDMDENERALQHLQLLKSELDKYPNAADLAKYFYLSSRANTDVPQARQFANNAVLLADSLKQIEILWRAEWRLAQLAVQEDQTDAAVALYEKTLSDLFNTAPQTVFEHYENELSATEEQFFQDYINFKIRNGQINSALNTVELLSRRNMLQQDFWNRHAYYQSPITIATRDSFYQERAYVRAQLVLTKNRHDNALFTSLQNRFELLQHELAKQLAPIGNQSTTPSTSDSVNVKNLADALPSDALVIRMFYDQENLHYWLISQDSVSYVQHPFDVDKLQEEIIDLQQRLNTREPMSATAAILYNELLSFIAPQLQSKGTLVFIPYGALYGLPFAVLAPEGTTPLGLEKQIIYGNNVSDSFNFDIRFTAPSIGAVYTSNAQAPNTTLSANVASSLSRYFSDVTIYEKDDFIDAASSTLQKQHDALYLGVDIAMNSQFPFDAELQSPFTSQENMLVFESWLVNRTASLVVFQSKHVSDPEFMLGTEDAMFSENLLNHSTHSLILPQWTPDDMTGSVLLKRFFRNLSQGQTPAEALRSAQKTVYDHIDAHPSAWAAYRLFGDF